MLFAHLAQSLLSQANLCLLLLFLELCLCELSLLVEGVDHLPEQLLLANSPLSIPLQVQLGVP